MPVDGKCCGCTASRLRVTTLGCHCAGTLVVYGRHAGPDTAGSTLVTGINNAAAVVVMTRRLCDCRTTGAHHISWTSTMTRNAGCPEFSPTHIARLTLACAGEESCDSYNPCRPWYKSRWLDFMTRLYCRLGAAVAARGSIAKKIPLSRSLARLCLRSRADKAARLRACICDGGRDGSFPATCVQVLLCPNVRNVAARYCQQQLRIIVMHATYPGNLQLTQIIPRIRLQVRSDMPNQRVLIGHNRLWRNMTKLANWASLASFHCFTVSVTYPSMIRQQNRMTL